MSYSTNLTVRRQQALDRYRWCLRRMHAARLAGDLGRVARWVSEARYARYVCKSTNPWVLYVYTPEWRTHRYEEIY